MKVNTTLYHSGADGTTYYGGEASGRGTYFGNSGNVHFADIGHSGSVVVFHGYYRDTGKYSVRNTVIQVAYGSETVSVQQYVANVGGADATSVYANSPSYRVVGAATTTNSNYQGTLHYHIWGTTIYPMVAFFGH